MLVLGIEVDDALIARWREWYSPEVQPFFVESRRGLPKSLGGDFTPETRDSFRAWALQHRGKKVVWYDEPTATRAGLSFRAGDDVVAFVEGEGLSHHQRPGAPEFAGTFPAGSGPNCFGAVMGAAGIVGAQHEWMQLEPFETWLRSNATKGGANDEPGTVLVWRATADRSPFHAALVLGDGWAFEKPSQCWWAPW